MFSSIGTVRSRI